MPQHFFYDDILVFYTLLFLVPFYPTIGSGDYKPPYSFHSKVTSNPKNQWKVSPVLTIAQAAYTFDLSLSRGWRGGMEGEADVTWGILDWEMVVVK
jgi:hypothetical protein